MAKLTVVYNIPDGELCVIEDRHCNFRTSLYINDAGEKEIRCNMFDVALKINNHDLPYKCSDCLRNLHD